MIINGALRKEKLVLTAGSANEALLIKGGLVGENAFLSVPPFGNRIDFSVDANNIVISKHSGQPLTYEEIRSFIKKIILFGRINERETRSLLELARTGVGSRLTLFYPNTKHPKVEVSFAYNWVSVEFEDHKFDDSFQITSDTITRSQKPTTKIFHNNIRNISIHDYSRDAIYIRRSSFEGITDALVGDKVFLPAEKNIFVLRSAAFNVKSVIYMEARRLTKGADENFEISDNKSLDPTVGRKELLVPLLNIIDEISKHGSFSGIKSAQANILYNILEKPSEYEKYSPSSSIKEALKSFAEDFAEEIKREYILSTSSKL